MHLNLGSHLPTVHFTPNLNKHIECPPQQVQGDTVRDVLQAVFTLNPKLGGYILDDQQRLRKHVVIFIDERTIADRAALSDAVAPDSEVYVMQALSGG